MLSRWVFFFFFTSLYKELKFLKLEIFKSLRSFCDNGDFTCHFSIKKHVDLALKEQEVFDSHQVCALITTELSHVCHNS